MERIACLLWVGLLRAICQWTDEGGSSYENESSKIPSSGSRSEKKTALVQFDGLTAVRGGSGLTGSHWDGNDDLW